MRPDEIDIDWLYLIERVEALLDLGEEYLSRRLVDTAPDPQAFIGTLAFVWVRQGEGGFLREVPYPDIPQPGDLVGLEKTGALLQRNIMQFVLGYPANDVLLWGAMGSGKSSLVKSLLGLFAPLKLRLIEIRKEDIDQLPLILPILRPLSYRFLLFCDDLAFGENDSSYRELKVFLEGGIEARPENVLVCATSNRRHFVPEEAQELCGGREIHPEEACAEKLALADRFGLRLSFYAPNQEDYLHIVRHLARRAGLRSSRQRLEEAALLWAQLHGGFSGRVARQFINDLSGQKMLRKRAAGKGDGPGK